MGILTAVDPDSTSSEVVADADGSVEVLGVDGGGKTVVGVVAELDNLIFGGELGDSADRAEDLLPHDLHVRLDVGEDGGLDEVALVTVALAANLDSSTLLLTGLDVAHDAVILKLADLGALEGLVVEGVTDLVLGGALLEGLDELVVDTLLDVDTRTGAASLAVVEVDTEVDPVNGLLDIGIVEDNVGGLATKLEGNLLQVGLGGSLHDLAADNGRASEGNLVDVHVGGDGGTSNPAETGDDVENARGETGLLDELSKDESRKRSLLSGLHDDGVTGGESGADLPGKHEEREVPGNDLTANTERLLPGVVEGIGGDIDGLALNLVGPTAVVADGANDSANIAAGHGDGLAIVERLNGGEEVEVLLDQVGKLEEVDATLLGSGLAPDTVESLAGGGDSKIDILLGGLVDGADDLLGSGVDDLEGLLLDTLDELVVDEPGRILWLALESLGETRGKYMWLETYKPVGCLKGPVIGVLSSTKTLEDILTGVNAEVGYKGYLGKKRQQEGREQR